MYNLKMGTITVNIPDEVEQGFRNAAGVVYGKKKGYLGKAMNQALLHWIKTEKKRADSKALELLDKGFEMGKLKFNRDELHER